LYAELVENDYRNQLIVDDVLNNYRQGRNCLVLSLRTAHVAALAEKLQEEVAEVISLTGTMGKKATKEAFQQLADLPPEKNFILVATGPFIGEGFDEPRLDTLFLAMPISWKGTLQQYAGRLHRLFATKKEVRIYDYVDIQVRMLEKMYQRRLNGYYGTTPLKGDILKQSNNLAERFVEVMHGLMPKGQIVVRFIYLTKIWIENGSGCQVT
jgi:superfamily II DNA or RNA helicase